MRIKDKISIVVILGLIGIFFTLIMLEKRKYSSIDTFSGEDRIPYKSKVIVANGCGVGGVAQQFRELLLKKAYIVYAPRNEKYWTYNESIVLSLDGNMDVAREIANSMGIKNCFMYKKEDSYEAVKVIIGKDYKEILRKNSLK